ncbi:cardiolipin synthase [Propionibacterium cyclohexanicum]|uniref:Cardiolipin synthase n=1 Tax=Propionibacterium cyclohexanicum TaxID=64702 RepID=A0A1H9QMW7_9ACTN|nr:CDP-alcohol phosphatidyltransferase family protein [Propionibacterium cyclohexanicum]SER61747.1 cardiolipin synthase [Propionibacterium cyclohexanicum]
MGDSQHSEVSVRETGYDTDAVITIPNLLSALRLAGVPLFLALILRHADVAAIVLLAIASATDWLDGKLARGLHQISRLGQMLDPVADRLYIAATVVGLTVRGIIPWWFLVVLLTRDIMMLCLVPALKTRGYTSLPVHFVGKAATFCLLYALPLVLLGAGPWGWAPAARIVGWAFALWGAFLYWWAGALYVHQTRLLLASAPSLNGSQARSRLH